MCWGHFTVTASICFGSMLQLKGSLYWEHVTVTALFVQCEGWHYIWAGKHCTLSNTLYYTPLQLTTHFDKRREEEEKLIGFRILYLMFSMYSSDQFFPSSVSKLTSFMLWDICCYPLLFCSRDLGDNHNILICSMIAPNDCEIYLIEIGKL